MRKKKRHRWKLATALPRAVLRIGGVPVYFHFPLANLAKFVERAVPQIAKVFDLKGDGVEKAAVALAVKTAMIAHEEAAVRSPVIKEEGDAYLLVILYCWQTGLFVPDQRLFPFSFEEVMSSFSQRSQINLSVVGATFSRVEE
jgi:hypothetical protein